MKKGTIEAYFHDVKANVAYSSEIQKFFGDSIKLENKAYGHFEISSKETNKKLYLMFGFPGALEERYIEVFLSTEKKTFWKKRKFQSFKSFFVMKNALLNFLSAKPIAKEFNFWQNG
ncbi:MAG TPA: hypothetical protein PLQ20_01815 [Candidatus Paceibacterota bacterium]|nr:hypothetical protein [Candidatus Paceibacterota bacterium]